MSYFDRFTTEFSNSQAEFNTTVDPSTDPEVLKTRAETARIMGQLRKVQEARTDAALSNGTFNAEQTLNALASTFSITSGNAWDPLTNRRTKRATLIGAASAAASSARTASTSIPSTAARLTTPTSPTTSPNARSLPIALSQSRKLIA